MSEDCLYLNVWTPAKSASAKVPVLVWIYGGGFNGGATSIPGYSGEVLAKKGVVLVSIAYRVGPIGFLAHPELSAESPQHVSGNYGLLDMIAACNGSRRTSPGLRRRSGQGDHLRRVGRRHRGQPACAPRRWPKDCSRARFPRAAAPLALRGRPAQPGENMRPLSDAEKDGLASQINAGSQARLPSCASCRRRRSGRHARHGVAEYRRLGDSRRSVQNLRRQESSTTFPSWSATTRMKARAFLRLTARRRITSTACASATAPLPIACSRPIPTGETTVPKTARDLAAMRPSAGRPGFGRGCSRSWASPRSTSTTSISIPDYPAGLTA
jgi:hypothetical protein